MISIDYEPIVDTERHSGSTSRTRICGTISNNPDGTVGARVPGGSYRWSGGWNQARPYAVGGVPYLFLLKKGDGIVQVHRLNDDGTVGARVRNYDWSSGWTSVEFYSTPSGSYLLLLKDTQKADSWLDIPFV